RASRDALRDRLAGAGVECDVDERFRDAVRLEHGARVSELPGYEEGLFSVQDPAAQSCAGLLRAGDGMRVLDACAAPGGKAAHLLEMADVSLTALELDAERAARIGENFARLGLEGDVVVGDATRPRDWHDGKPFDRILVDAPCSATGIMRRHPDVRWLRRPDDIEANARVQAALLENLWPLLAPGGLLVYATCSILHAENRDRARAFLDAHPDAEIQPPKVPGAVDVGAGEQVLPGNLDRDGFYYLRLRRLQSG
ncbi:MAG: 16S rRNA (cytosine(967)-C(5))-methyltransferase RsmB, partial [Wenzhouxiangellaceae bacterium]|nr:16S rRNA (cytosine(967)-C(5))-methyltransferase RsmB [Wenzhouxiangellaceae bacterium]